MNTQTTLKTKHTYLFEEGTWSVSGSYCDSENNDLEVKGENQIKHNEDKWLLDDYFELQNMTKTHIQSKYKVTPVSKDSEFTFWESEHPDLGTLLGRVMVVGNTIMSMYQSESRLYAGTEVLEKINDNKYHARGFNFNGDEKLSSWNITLERVK